MAYTTGDLRLTIQQCGHPGCDGDPECWETGGRFWVRDAREAYRREDDLTCPHEKHGAYLPHSCDEWYIGGRAEIEALIADLKKALEDMG